MLTAQQARLFRFIESTMARKGAAPSFREMRDAMGLKSGSGIHRLLTGLEERGFIRRLPCRARAIEIVRKPVVSAYIDAIIALPVADTAAAERRQILNLLRSGDVSVSAGMRGAMRDALTHGIGIMRIDQTDFINGGAP